MTTKSLFLGICLLGILSFSLMYAIRLVVAPMVRNDEVYMAASIDKEHLLATATKPRLIFVGGSGLALGLNSTYLESQLGVRVINMGLHAGLGLSYSLNETQAGLKRRDVVIISTEYFLANGNSKLLAQLVDVNPKAYNFLSLSVFDKIRLFAQSVQRCLSNLFYKVLKINRFDLLYNRGAFSPNGDFKSHFGKQKPGKLSDNTIFKDIDYSTEIDEINDFISVAKNKGVSVFYAYPSFAASAFERNKLTLTKLSHQHKTSLNCPVIGTPKSFVLPDSLFFDTVYHLDSLGVQKRTSIMANLLMSKRIAIHRKHNP